MSLAIYVRALVRRATVDDLEKSQSVISEELLRRQTVGQINMPMKKLKLKGE